MNFYIIIIIIIIIIIYLNRDYMMYTVFNSAQEYMVSKNQFNIFVPLSNKVRTFFKIVGLPNQLDQLDSSKIDFRVVMGNSMNELNHAQRLISYPNPVKEELNIEMPQYTQSAQFSIYNMMGQNMEITPSFSSLTGEIKFNTSILPSGMYLVYGKNNGKNYQVRFIKD